MRKNSTTRCLLAAATAAAALCAPSAFASYANYGGLETISFSTLSTAWGMNGSTRLMTSSPAPGSASFSVMGAGLAGNGPDPHGGNLTSVLANLYAGGVDEATTLGLALSKWAAVSGFINLGQVADGGGAIGATGAAGGRGDIRVGAIFIDGNVGGNVLAHAYQPCNESFCNASYGGDMHFDNTNVWSDGGGAGTIDFYTVALHEFGHALGLGHSNVVGSVMEAFYGGQRRNLSADDIAGIQAIYGMAAVPVPEPGTHVLMVLGALGVWGAARKRKGQAAAAV
jgi:hypothetical protein